MNLFKNVSNHFFLNIALKTSMKGSDLIFGYAETLYYKCHKVNLKYGGSYIDSADSIKNKIATLKS